MLEHIGIQRANRETHNAARRANAERTVGMRKRITRVRELETGESVGWQGTEIHSAVA